MSKEFDGIYDILDDFANNIHFMLKELNEKSNTIFGLLSDDFMQKYTDYKNLSDFFNEGNFDVNCDADIEWISEADLDRHTKNTTTFESWKLMIDAAVEYLENQLRKYYE